MRRKQPYSDQRPCSPVRAAPRRRRPASLGLAFLARVRTPLLVLAALLLWPAIASAQIGSARYSSIIIEATSGRVLESVAADEPRYPASLTKMMTLYMLFEALRDRRVSLEQPVPVSGYAASMPPSKLGLTPGVRVTVEDMLLGLITKSANDAAAAIAELIGGSEDRFAEMMTLRARALGLASTMFRNASGLPDPQQLTTARDMAVLARHLVQDFPEQYHYFSTPSFLFHGRLIRNHDHMLTTYPGADGIKTGYTVAAGHNLVTSALRDGVRLIGVVLGAAANGERDIHMADLLDQGFLSMNVAIAPRHEPAATFVAIPRLVGLAQAAPMPVPPGLPLRRPEAPRPKSGGGSHSSSHTSGFVAVSAGHRFYAKPRHSARHADLVSMTAAQT